MIPRWTVEIGGVPFKPDDDVMALKGVRALKGADPVIEAADDGRIEVRRVSLVKPPD